MFSFSGRPVTFTAYSTSYYCLKLLGILENSTGKWIALPVWKFILLVMHKIRKNTACTDALLSANIPFQDYPLPDIDSTINLHSWVKTLHWTVNTEKETRSSIQKQFLLCSAVSFDILTVRLGNTFQLIFLLNSIRVWWTLKRKKKRKV